MSLDITNIFQPEKKISSYEKLGLGRLIYHIPINLCYVFIKEFLEEKSLNLLDEEIMITSEMFLKNSLNIAETSRKLYIHRNSLVYRLDKIESITGLDIRSFYDAMIFKIVIMISNYIKNKEI